MPYNYRVNTKPGVARDMRKAALVIMLAAIASVAVMPGPAGAGDNDAVIHSEDILDDDGYNYGINFYIDNLTDSRLYVVTVITYRENVVGNVLNGVLLLGPHEKGALVGSFTADDISRPWGANIRAYWNPCLENLEVPQNP
jgi:hypothetical protein